MPLKMTLLSILFTLISTMPLRCADAQDIADLRRNIESLKLKDQSKSGEPTCIIDDRAIESCYKFYETSYISKADLSTIAPAVFRWQIRASNTILVLVVILTGGGLLFAGVQLWYGLGLSGRRLDLKGSPTSLEVGPSGIKISSSVVGLVTLIVAYLFLLLFLKEVYRIEVVGENNHGDSNRAIVAQQQSR